MLELMDFKVHKDQLVQQEKMVQLVKLVLPQQEMLVHKAIKETLDLKVHKDRLEAVEILELQDSKVS
jgi:hypothetical protein